MNKGRSELGMKMLDKVCVCVRVLERKEREWEREGEKERESEFVCLTGWESARESFGHDDDKTRMMTRKKTNQYEIGHCKEYRDHFTALL